MGTIASLNVMLTASAGPFAAVMRGATSSLKSVSGVVSEVSSKIFGLTGAITGIASVAGLSLLVKDSMEAMASTGRLSDRLGITTEKLGGLQYGAKLAGISSESLTTGLEHMLKNLSAASDKTTPAAAALAKMSLSADQLKKMSPDEAFSKIAQGLVGIKNPADRAAAAVEIFGKSGQELLPLLLQGSQGIAAAQAEAQKLGLTFSRVDAAKVEQANQGFIRMQAVVQGAVQTLAIQLAPFITATTEKLVQLATSGQGAGRYIVNAFNAVLGTVANLADMLGIVEAGWQILRGAASYAIGGILDGIGWLIDGINKLSAKLHIAAIGGAEELHNLGKAFYETGNDAFAKAGEDWKQFTDGTNSQAAVRAINDIENASQTAAASIAKDAAAMNAAGGASEDYAAKLKTAEENAKKITETLAELQKQVQTFGQNEGQKKLFDLKALGADPAQIDEAQKAVEQLTKLENFKKASDLIADTQKQIRQFGMTENAKKFDDLSALGLDSATLKRAQDSLNQLEAISEAKKKMEQQKSDAKAIIDATRTPMEKYTEQVTKLSGLLNSGAIDWQTYGRAIRQARMQLEDIGKTDGPQAFEAGSAEAQRFAYDNSRGQMKQDPNADDIAKRSFNEQYQSRLILQRMENDLVDQAAATETVVNLV